MDSFHSCGNFSLFELSTTRSAADAFILPLILTQVSSTLEVSKLFKAENLLATSI